jgi:hypothetical protein
MKALKNIFFGFLVSFLGSLPLGYLNIIGVDIFSKWGMNSLISYLLGVILVETVVIYLTVVFANKLANNKKILKFIDFFAVFFLFLIAYLFYTNSSSSSESQNYLEEYQNYSPFLIGLVLCGLNFIQIPFWMGWNLYLVNAKSIFLDGKLKFHYVFGTLVGTFLGMLSVIVLLDSLSENLFSFSKYIMPIVIPLFFVTLAIFQAIKVYRKYYRKL